MTIYLVRHAHAGDRSAWSGNDRERPLSPRGRAQAAAIAARYGDRPVARVLSSPAVRCQQTVQPIADARGLAVEVVAWLDEGTMADAVLEHLVGLAHDDVVLCSHGDVIPALMRLMMNQGLAIDGGAATSKASVFEITTKAGEFTAARYVPPPDRRD